MCLFPKIGITELSDAEFAVLTGFLNLLVISYALYRYLYLRSVTVFFLRTVDAVCICNSTIWMDTSIEVKQRSRMC